MNRPLGIPEPAPELEAERLLCLGLEARGIGAGRAHAGGERRPEVVEVVVRRFDHERHHLDVLEPGAAPELVERVGSAVSQDLVLSGDPGVERGGGVPEGAE